MARNRVEQAPRTPPRIANQIVLFLLRTPLHGLVSNVLLLLTFKGRKSGKSFTTPLGYTQQGKTITLFTDHPWWKNLRANPSVTITLKGKTFEGVAEVIAEDRDAIEKALLAFVRERPQAARAYSVTMDAAGQPDPASVNAAANRFTLIRVHLV